VESFLNTDSFQSRETMNRIRRAFINSLHLNIREEDFSYEDKLDEAAGLDSVAVLDFVTALEKEFGFTFQPEMLTIDVMRDLHQLAAYVDEQVARRRARPESGA
jgi:acyl carrier protein